MRIIDIGAVKQGRQADRLPLRQIEMIKCQAAMRVIGLAEGNAPASGHQRFKSQLR